MASVARQLAALERLVGLDVLGHPLLDPGQVLLARAAVRELDVVVEAIGDRRPDRDLRVGPEVEHRLGQHVSGVVANQLQRLGALSGDDLDRSPSSNGAERSRSSPSTLSASAAFARPGPIAGRGVGAGRPGLELELGAIRQVQLQLLC